MKNTKKQSKIVERAISLKSKGFKYMAAVIKSVYNTSYYNVQSIDDVIKVGKWIGIGHPLGFARYQRMGTRDNNIDWSITARK